MAHCGFAWHFSDGRGPEAPSCAWRPPVHSQEKRLSLSVRARHPLASVGLRGGFVPAGSQARTRLGILGSSGRPAPSTRACSFAHMPLWTQPATERLRPGDGCFHRPGEKPTAGCLFIFQSTVSVYQTMISFGVCVAKSTPLHRRAPSQEPRGALARAGWGFGVQTKHLSGCLSPYGGGAGRRQEQQLQ